MALAAFAALLPPAFSATIVSDSRIVLTGGPFHGETFTLPRVNGDWYVTPGDAHAGLALRPAASAAHQGTFTIEWDGKASAQIVNAANNDKVNDQRFAFYLQLLAPYNQTLQPRGADAIEITIVRMDDLNLEANISGTATGAAPGPVQISGTLKLHRDHSDQKVSGAFGNCDPGIHDKLVFAEWRSPSECEVKFDRYIREALLPPFARMEAALTQGEWTEVRKPAFRPITSIARRSEGNPFSLQSTQDGFLRFEFRLRPGSDQAKRNEAALEALSKKMAEAMKSVEAAKAFSAEMTEATHVSQGSGNITIAVRINLASLGIANFQGAYTASQIPGVGYSVTAPYVQSRGGGDIGGAHETTFVFLGPWSPATGTKTGDGGTNITVKAALSPKAPTLTLQNIEIEIEANQELARKVIGLIDWNALNQLLAAKPI